VKKHRYKISFSITSLLYIALFFAYLYTMNQKYVVSQEEKDKVINISLSQFVPEVIELPPEPEPIVEPEPEPVPEVEPEPEQIPEPIVEKKIVAPVPIVEKPKKIEKKIPKKKIVKKRVVKKKNTKKSVRKKSTSSRRATSSRVDANKKSKFLAQIRAKINRAKSYPRIAQRRGMQGVVKVRFTILKNGRVGHISIKGPKVFHSSARSAVKKAFPINTKNAPLNLPTTVNLSLRYKLR